MLLVPLTEVECTVLLYHRTDQGGVCLCCCGYRFLCPRRHKNLPGRIVCLLDSISLLYFHWTVGKATETIARIEDEAAEVGNFSIHVWDELRILCS